MQIQQTHVICCFTYLHELRLCPSTITAILSIRGSVRQSDEVRREASMDELAGMNGIESREDLREVVL